MKIHRRPASARRRIIYSTISYLHPLLIPFFNATINNLFQIKEKLGNGSFGVIYRAVSTHPATAGASYACKVEKMLSPPKPISSCRQNIESYKSCMRTYRIQLLDSATAITSAAMQSAHITSLLWTC